MLEVSEWKKNHDIKPLKSLWWLNKSFDYIRPDLSVSVTFMFCDVTSRTKYHICKFQSGCLVLNGWIKALRSSFLCHGSMFWRERHRFLGVISGCLFATWSDSISINDQCGCLPALPGKGCPISAALSCCSCCWDRENKERFVPAAHPPTHPSTLHTTNAPPTRNQPNHQKTQTINHPDVHCLLNHSQTASSAANSHLMDGRTFFKSAAFFFNVRPKWKTFQF